MTPEETAELFQGLERVDADLRMRPNAHVNQPRRRPQPMTPEETADLRMRPNAYVNQQRRRQQDKVGEVLRICRLYDIPTNRVAELLMALHEVTWVLDTSLDALSHAFAQHLSHA